VVRCGPNSFGNSELKRPKLQEKGRSFLVTAADQMCLCYKNHFPRQLAGRFCRNASMPSAASSKSRLHAITSLATS
jgi:hypothetical protein